MKLEILVGLVELVELVTLVNLVLLVALVGLVKLVLLVCGIVSDCVGERLVSLAWLRPPWSESHAAKLDCRRTHLYVRRDYFL